ncbi:glycerol-3-phosphate dehydrogenase [NAD(P)+] [Roseobacter cerasinus]|uniref:Glycerol-3-phosphate dehydrogenase [NAD(P)+] n=1 Tax=Roseobacter cerasinus TaxID=2602289 RepID=A0A640VMX1_9RHOB|nr:NAD(P)H-dependent glycerol-3-phosphate dehydrogenase [Roseobacter cerasinus]GFE49389.1 glycerol-3-phosphate dehydrogenase [NAD(P)+] [Roseobacter cerasinus]
MSVGVLGAGAFGTALAIALARKAPVQLWARSETRARDMATHRQNTAYLPEQAFPEQLMVTANLQELAGCDTLLLAVPMQQLDNFIAENAAALQEKTLVACCKGVDLRSGDGPAEIIARHLPDTGFALLTGPSFARDIAVGLPTGLTLACTDDGRGQALQKALSTPALRLYRTTDVIGATLGGALKNVIAIACGATIGAGLGESARATVLTRGFAEMQRLALRRGAQAATLSGLSGFGDLVLTCTSEQSRNYRFGRALGQGTTFDPSVTVEGAATARAVRDIAARDDLDMPITSAVAGLVENRLDVTQAMQDLLSRSLKEE